jgi:hypothetical protein
MADCPMPGVGEVDARTTTTIEADWYRLPVIVEKRTNGECQNARRRCSIYADALRRAMQRKS